MRRRRNPSVKGLTQGVGAMDVVAGLGGFIASGIVPTYIIKPADGTTELTSNQKLMKLGVSAVTAFGLGYVGKKFMSAGTGKMLTTGGLIGVGNQAITNYTSFNIQRNNVRRALPGGVSRSPGVSRRANVGVPVPVSPGMTRAEETATLLMP